MRLHVLAARQGHPPAYSPTRAPGGPEREAPYSVGDTPAGWGGRLGVSEQIRVLVVEDDADTAQYVRTVLERRGGMHVTVAHEPMSALAEVAAHQFDVVLTDIQMPGMSGLELLGELRSRAPGTPVAVMTAFASVDYAV